MKRSEELRIERRRFSFWLALMAGLHVSLLASAVAYQHFFGSKQRSLNIVSVSLVSLPGSGGSPLPGSGGEPGPEVQSKELPVAAENRAEIPAEVPVAKPEPKPLPVPERKNVVETPRQKVPEKPVPPKSVPAPAAPTRQQDLDNAFAKLRKSVDSRPSASGRQENLGSALARLQQKVASQGGRGSGSGSGGGSASGSGSGRGGGGTGLGGGGGTADPYKVKIAGIIQQNWEFSSQMLRNSYGMEVYVHIFVLPDGTIRDITYDKRAPSAYLNNSVKRALEKSSPLPPLPGGQGSGGVSIGFVFTPEGIDM